ncbi:ETEC_3214 domain-containing protein [Amycolatopsis sp. NPDC048633]|uniref:ETEC_3214 domain-containing protein n=1 Tax=Amycolatopsis sp. NPDC048633 TaxID=3157095 RepID=UPI0033EFB549
MSVISNVWDVTANTGGQLLRNAGPIVAAIAISKLLLDLWRKTLGRRRRWVRLYRRLSLGLQLDYAVELFGKAAYKASARDGEGNEVTEYVWPLATDAYLQAIVGDDSIIKRYSLTTTSRWFRPRFKMGSPGNSATFEVKLGKTSFSSLPGEPSDVYLARGASFYEYGENRYLGRPGKYADWICSYTQMGVGRLKPIPINVPADDSVSRLPGNWYVNLSDADKKTVESARAGSVVNTITVSKLPHTNPGVLSFGPRFEEVELRAH